MPSFEDIKLDPKDNAALSICCHNGNSNVIKHLKYAGGQW